LIVLVDAHALLWWLGDDPGLGADARGVIADPTTDVLVSAGTVWEIAIKRALGRLDAPAELVAAIEAAVSGVLPGPRAGAARATALPRLHADPLDRILGAQAQRLDALIVTRDAAILAYDVETLPA
jgi:PIN domain nuclease of toxin-antitoxin system